MTELVLILLIAALLWAWIAHRQAQEIAITAARSACQRAGLQFLDETAGLSRLILRRDAEGRLAVHRTFTFEYTDVSGNRIPGRVVMLGPRLIGLDLGPTRGFDQSD